VVWTAGAAWALQEACHLLPLLLQQHPLLPLQVQSPAAAAAAWRCGGAPAWAQWQLPQLLPLLLPLLLL
jgi:hypothetical protein